MSNNDFHKIVLIGGDGSGKTSFLRGWCNQEFELRYLPTVETVTRTATLQNGAQQIELQFSDIGGQNIVNAQTINLLTEADLILIFYDTNRSTSAKKVFNYLELIRNRCPATKVVVIGTCADVGIKTGVPNSRILSNKTGGGFDETVRYVKDLLLE